MSTAALQLFHATNTLQNAIQHVHDPQPNTSFRRWLNRQAKFYYQNVFHCVLISFYLSNDNVYVLYIPCIFPLFCYVVTQVRLSFVQ